VQPWQKGCVTEEITPVAAVKNQKSGAVKRVPPACVVLVDEAYHHFVESPKYRSALELAGRHDNVVVTRTFSKIYGMAGMRLGYGVASIANAGLMQTRADIWTGRTDGGPHPWVGGAAVDEARESGQ